jgi:hypothetical protein
LETWFLAAGTIEFKAYGEWRVVDPLFQAAVVEDLPTHVPRGADQSAHLVRGQARLDGRDALIPLLAGNRLLWVIRGQVRRGAGVASDGKCNERPTSHATQKWVGQAATIHCGSASLKNHRRAWQSVPAERMRPLPIIRPA